MPRLLRREWIPYLILITALMVTAATARYAYLNRLNEDGLRFRNAATAIQATIYTRLENYVAMLLGGAGLFAASDEVTRAEFRAYVGRLELPRHYPGIQAIGFARVVHDDDREDVQASAREFYPTFEYWPHPPRTGDFTSIVYIEPDDERNRGALGYDMESEATRRTAMERARDQGTPAATRRLRLVQERNNPGPQQAGFLIYVPVYRSGRVPDTQEERRKNIIGYIYSPFRADDLFNGIVTTEEVVKTTAIEVYDGTAEEGQLLHRRHPGTPTDLFTVSRNMEVAGVKWTLVLRGGEAVRLPGQTPILTIIIGGGLALSALLFLITRSQVLGRAHAERRAEELRLAGERLRELDREKDAFLATISHELRTPLNAIVGWASMLGRGAVPAETQAHAIEVIKRNAAAQTRLIEDLLDMSRAVAGHLNLQVVDVDAQATLDAAVDALRPLADNAGVSLTAESAGRLGTIEADSGRLQQIVMNLLSNAVKFTPRGGEIKLRAERAGGTLVVTVADTGIGIDPKFVPFLFDRFRQADSSPTRAHSGAGLGLAIAKHLVDLHRGTIEVISAGTGRGATFIVRIPASRRVKSAVPPARSQPTSDWHSSGSTAV